MALRAVKVPTSKTNLPTIYVEGNKILKMVHGSHHLTTSLSNCINNIEIIEAIVAVRQSQVSIRVGNAELHDIRCRAGKDTPARQQSGHMTLEW
jgi:hypothetical protein